MAWRAIVSILFLLSFFLSGSLSQLHNAEPRGPTHLNKFGVEVKGPASQLLHKQALEYIGHSQGNYYIDHSAQFEPSSEPPSKGAGQKDHASVLSVAVYTLLMAGATVNGLFGFSFAVDPLDSYHAYCR